jgi:hypothetical protein
MSRAMTPPPVSVDFWLLDEEVRDNPRRLSRADTYVHAGPGWRRSAVAVDDPEDDR